MVAVMVNSGELPTARGKSGYDLERVIARWQQIADGRFEDDCRFLLQMIDETDELELWKHAANGFYKSRDDFLQKHVLIDFDLTEQSLAEIVGRLRKGERVPLARHGAIGNGRRLDNVNSTAGGNGAEYTMRRLMRDRPDLVERVDAGELSPHAAAIVAGFKQRTISIRANPASAAQSILNQFGEEIADKIAEEINRLRGRL
jgi:hypothetical protein